MTPVHMNEAEMALRAGMAFIEAFNRRDRVALLALLAPDCRYEPHDQPADAPALTGREAVAAWFADLITRHPDAFIRAEHAFGFGKRCVFYWRYTLTEGRDLMRGVEILQVSEGLIQHQYSYVKSVKFLEI